MVEFGEQLRRAREEKGMTQQSLAERLYVTRQAVSRWECGDRYPDLLTTKKISQILDISLDELLSGKEMDKAAERNPVIEKKGIRNLMIALYAATSVSLLITVADILLRFPLQSEAIDYSDIQMIIVNVLGMLTRLLAMAFGLAYAVQGTLSPKKTGIIITAYFGTMCLTGSEYLAGCTNGQLALAVISFLIPNAMGAVAAFLFFVHGKKDRICSGVIYLVSVWELGRLVLLNASRMVWKGSYLSLRGAAGLLLHLALYGLIICQTRTLEVKRRKAAYGK